MLVFSHDNTAGTNKSYIQLMFFVQHSTISSNIHVMFHLFTFKIFYQFVHARFILKVIWKVMLSYLIVSRTFKKNMEFILNTVASAAQSIVKLKFAPSSSFNI